MPPDVGPRALTTHVHRWVTVRAVPSRVTQPPCRLDVTRTIPPADRAFPRAAVAVSDDNAQIAGDTDPDRLNSG